MSKNILRCGFNLLIACISIILISCVSDRNKPPMINPNDPAVIYSVAPPPKTEVEFIDSFTIEEQKLLDEAIDYYLEEWRKKLAQNPGFLPAPQIVNFSGSYVFTPSPTLLNVLIQLHRDSFECNGVKVNGCAHVWEGRVGLWAGDLMEAPALIHELLHYHLPYPFDPKHEDPRWAEWQDWIGEVRKILRNRRRLK